LVEARTAPSMAALLLKGNVLTIDPSSGGSSMPGYAICREGRFVENGELRLPKGSLIHHRLHTLQKAIQALVDTHGPFDLLIHEDIALAFGAKGGASKGPKGSKGNPHGGFVTRGTTFLQWSVGVTLSAQPWPHVVRVAPQSWWAWVRKNMPPDSYVKGDATDALCMLCVVFHDILGRLPDGTTIEMLKS